MGIIGEKLNIDFVVSTGDNFYDDGLTGVDDPAFEESFINVYKAPSLQKNWYNGQFISHPFLSFKKKNKKVKLSFHFSCPFNYYIVCYDFYFVLLLCDVFVVSCCFLYSINTFFA